jgi:tetratricopeptide (TPR) repeat protein
MFKIKVICLIIISGVVVPALAQNKLLPVRQWNTYDTATKENFKKLGFDWALPLPIQEAMDDGLQSLSAGDWKLALKSFDKVIEFDSTFIPAYYYKYSCFEISKRRLSQEEYKNLILVNEQIPNYSDRDIYMDLWDLFIPNKQYPRRNRFMLEIAPPLSNLSKYLVEHLGDANMESSPYLNRGLSFIMTAKPKEALIQINKAIKIDSSICSLYLKAMTFQFMTRHDSAYFFYEKILKKDETIIDAHENLALYKNQIGNKIGALHHLNCLNKLHPGSSSVWHFSGLLKVLLQDYYGAIIDLTKYIKLDPENFDCLKQRAVAQFEVKNYNGAIHDLESALKISNKNLEVYLYLSENYFQLGDSAMSIKVLRNAEKLYYFDQRLDLFTADKLVDINKVVRAQEILNRVTRGLSSEKPNKSYLRQSNLIQCKIYLKKGTPEKAIERLSSLINIEEEHDDYLLLRAKAFLMSGNKTQAKADLEKLMQNNFKPAIDLYNSL